MAMSLIFFLQFDYIFDVELCIRETKILILFSGKLHRYIIIVIIWRIIRLRRSNFKDYETIQWLTKTGFNGKFDRVAIPRSTKTNPLLFQLHGNKVRTTLKKGKKKENERMNNRDNEWDTIAQRDIRYRYEIYSPEAVHTSDVRVFISSGHPLARIFLDYFFELVASLL